MWDLNSPNARDWTHAPQRRMQSSSHWLTRKFPRGNVLSRKSWLFFRSVLFYLELVCQFSKNPHWNFDQKCTEFVDYQREKCHLQHQIILNEQRFRFFEMSYNKVSFQYKCLILCGFIPETVFLLLLWMISFPKFWLLVTHYN